MMSGTVTPRLASRVGIHPDAHGIGSGAEYLHLPDTGKTGERILQINRGIVGQEDVVVIAIGRIASSSMKGAVVARLHDYALLGHFTGQLRIGLSLRICARIWSVLMSVPSWKSTYRLIPPPELALSEYM